jgi:hypothetical protein
VLLSPGNPAATLASLGLCSGDLLWLMLPQPEDVDSDRLPPALHDPPQPQQQQQEDSLPRGSSTGGNLRWQGGSLGSGGGGVRDTNHRAVAGEGRAPDTGGGHARQASAVTPPAQQSTMAAVQRSLADGRAWAAPADDRAGAVTGGGRGGSGADQRRDQPARSELTGSRCCAEGVGAPPAATAAAAAHRGAGADVDEAEGDQDERDLSAAVDHAVSAALEIANSTAMMVGVSLRKDAIVLREHPFHYLRTLSQLLTNQTVWSRLHGRYHCSLRLHCWLLTCPLPFMHDIL